MLDVGCGPGTITLDLARLVSPGRVVGLDLSAAVIEKAEVLRASQRVGNAEFVVGDVYRLSYGEHSFDVVHAHQVLQHLTDPIGALSELRRVASPRGVLAVRDGDYGAFTWWPADPVLDRWLGALPPADPSQRRRSRRGRRLMSWVQAAGFADLSVSTSTWTFADPQSRAWWGGLWADRVRLSSFGEQAVAVRAQR